ncbi:class I SAM-dependent methyltransferase [Catalinimonas sp. 4WD22]|uniref:class I SAM-dependent methyltransferase n=1 Tax=Catalinimonas locisalis TaxID=3133978 RepID=UPI003100AEE7
MKMDIPTKAERFWDRTASHYDRAEEGDQKTFLQIIERSKSHLKASDLLLDVGCGTGLAANTLAPAVAEIHAIDISSSMIEIARAKAEKQQIHNIDYRHATVFDDQLKPGAYNVVLCLYLLHLLDDPAQVMQRLYALLKPGGIFISVTPCMGEKPVQAALFSVLSSIGMTPPIKKFKRTDLENLISRGGFHIEGCELLTNTSNQYFVLASR